MNLPNLILKLVGVENRSHAPQFRTDAMEVVTYIDIGAHGHTKRKSNV
jgi:hypothetical protein